MHYILLTFTNGALQFYSYADFHENYTISIAFSMHAAHPHMRIWNMNTWEYEIWTDSVEKFSILEGKNYILKAPIIKF